MKKGNKLTVYIIAAMILGIGVGYVVNQYGTGNTITYTSKKDFTGSDTLQVSVGKEWIQQPILVVKDSSGYKKKIDSVTKDVRLIVSNFPTNIEINAKGHIASAPIVKNGSATITAINSIADILRLLSTIFIRLVQMIIAPLVFTTLVVGIAKLGDLKTVGRVGGKAILWFVTASLASLLIGMVLVNFFQPGKYISLGQKDVEGLADLATKQKGFSLQNFIEHVIPKSFVEAMANNEILQLVIFSVFLAWPPPLSAIIQSH